MTADAASKRVELKREAGLFQVVTYGVGNIIGAGIYVLVGDASGLAGGLVWLSFLIGAVVALFTGLSYAELASVYPRAASEYVFLGRAYGSPILSFITQWVMWITEIVAAAAVALGFAGYLASVVPVPQELTAATLLAALTMVAIVGVKESLRLNTLLSIVAIAGLVVVVAGGIGKLGSASLTTSANGFPGILGAVVLVFFAYIGFDNISNLSEETKRPDKTIPRGLLVAVALSTALYLLVGISAVSLVPWQQLAASDAPLALAVSTVFGSAGSNALTVAALLTTLNTVLVLLLVSSRILYGMGREGALPGALGKVNARTRTPILASLVTLGIALTVLPLGQVAAIAKVTSFGSLIVFALVNLALLHLRRTAPSLARPFKAPLSVGWVSITALLGLVTCLALLTQFDLLSVILGLVLPISGMLVDLGFGGRKTVRIDEAIHQKHEASSHREGDLIRGARPTGRGRKH